MLVVNAGSSSLKLRLLEVGGHDADDADLDAAHDAAQVIEQADLPAPDEAGSHDLEQVLAEWPAPTAVGHRVVHGGSEFTGPVLLDASVRAQLDRLSDLAPLHQPKSLAALDATAAVLPQVPAVACFDTAFHAGMPAAAATYAVPARWRSDYAIRRYGFHGLSHAYAAGRAAAIVGRPLTQLRVVTCHLGAGASLCAVRGGRSVDTTMGFTPLEGLVMATRSGSVDPGLVLWLEEHERLAPAEVAEALERRSGLAALAGTPDMREVEARVAAGDPDARLALDVYLHRLVGAIASMAAACAGLDVLVFTGGVGEHSAQVRSAAAAQLGWLGVAVDAEHNEAAGSDAGADVDVTAGSAGARVRTLVVHAREDLQIARETYRLLAGS